MSLIALLVAGIVIWRGIMPTRLHVKIKYLLSAAALLIAFKFQLLYWFGGMQFFAPKVSKEILVFSAWLYASEIIFLFFLLAGEIFRAGFLLSLKLLNRARPENYWTVSSRINFVFLIIALIGASFGISAGVALPEVKEVSVSLANYPANEKPLTIAVLADIHADPLTNAQRVEKLVERTNALKADLIVIAGDFVDGAQKDRADDLRPLTKLSAPMGVFGAMGNHEYFSGYEEWVKFLPTLGIRMLINEHAMLCDGKIALGGVTDTAAFRLGGEKPDIDKTFKGIASGTLKLLIAHQPRIADDSAKKGVDLQISGHTHGGMIPVLSELVAIFNGGYVSGLYKVGDMTLLVSSGSGIWSGFPIRIGHPSEIILLKISGK